MRVAYISPPWLPVPPPAYGGSEVVIDRLARGAQLAGHEVMLFATGDSSCPVDRRWSRQQAVPESIGDARVELAQVIAAYTAVREWGADIVHDHTLIGPAYARHCSRVPVVTTNHGPFTGELSTIYRDAAQSAAIVAISHAQAATAQDIPIARVIHHGVDPMQYPMGAGDGGFVLFLGRMCADKGVREAALIARAAGARLLIAAKMREPNERAYFASQVEPLLTDRIQFVGEVAGAVKMKLLGAAAALLNPIRWAEPFGLVMIEALACGTPVVSYPLGSAPEIVDDGRTGFIGQDQQEMINRLGEVSKLDRQVCRRSVHERFSQQRMVNQHLELYAQLLGGTAPTARRVARVVIAGQDRGGRVGDAGGRRWPGGDPHRGPAVKSPNGPARDGGRFAAGPAVGNP